MSVSLKQLSNWLDDFNIKYTHHDKHDVITFAYGDEKNRLGYRIETVYDGSIFKIYMNLLDTNGDYISCKDNKYLNKILTHVLFSNYTTHFGTWEYDYRDGDIRFAIEIPLEDAEMTVTQFQRILQIMVENGTEMSIEIKSLMETGELPEKSEDDDKIKKIAALKAMLAQLEGESGDDSFGDKI